jgi:hypothetical protein
MTRTTGRTAAVLSALALTTGTLALTATTPAGAAPAEDPRTLAKGLLSPLSTAVARDGTAYVTQNFAGQLAMKRPGKKLRTIYTSPVAGTEVGAISERRGNLAFATTQPDARTFLYRVGNSGKAHKVANLYRHEKQKNPDADVVYGVRNLSEECQAEWPTGPEAPPATYTGIVESHPYATTQTKRRTYVADAAGNTILSVNRKGRVRTVAVLPGNNIIITPSLAEEFGIPECALGKKYWFEGVPTDVEKGPRGKLYVTSLPGGPEDPSLGERGSIFRVNPKTGKVRRVVEELMSPTGLAVAPSGAMYVAELFASRISRVRAGGDTARVWTERKMPGDVEWTRRGVHATVNVLSGLGEGEPAGRLLRWRR